jgi:hypothetical protein
MGTLAQIGRAMQDPNAPAIGNTSETAKKLQDARQKAMSERTPSKQSLQEAEDERMRRLEEKAPTTKTEMGKPFKKGGAVKARGCGIAERGLTKGKMR